MKNFIKSIACLAVYFVIQFLMQMVFMLSGTLLGIKSQNELMEFCMNHLFLLTILSNIVTVLLFILYMKIQKKNITEEWNLIPAKLKTYIAPCASVFLLSFAWAFITYDISFTNTQQIEKSTNFYSRIFPGFGIIMMALTLLLAQPVIEEILCRGIILNKLKNSMPVWGAVIVSSLLFGIIHLMAGGAALTIGAAIMGICFGLIFVKTKSLYIAIAAHAFANLPDFLMPYLPKPDFSTRIILALVLAAISIIIMILFCKKEEKI